MIVKIKVNILLNNDNADFVNMVERWSDQWSRSWSRSPRTASNIVKITINLKKEPFDCTPTTPKVKWL